MYHRILKGASTLAYIFLIVLTWRWIKGELDWSLAVGAALLSAFWLVITGLQMRSLLRTYFDVLSRAQVLLPLTLGLIFSGLAIFAFDSLPLRLVSTLELIAWAGIYTRYRLNRRKFVNQGHGPLPVGCLVNPAPELIEPLDLVLTSGRIATRLEESVGHGEVAIRLEDGTIGTFTSLMEKGTVIKELKSRIEAWRRSGEHYIVLKLTKKQTAEQILRATAIARELLAKNIAWRERTTARRARIINGLPLPDAWKARLIAKWRVTGYDWNGLFGGRLAPDHWTCVGACLELYHQLGIKTAQYGTGLLGIGTGLLDPIMPVRFLDDPAFRFVSVEDEATLKDKHSPT